MKETELTQSKLKEALFYNEKSGFFIWIKKPPGRIKAGDVAGSIQTAGYVQIRVYGKLYLAHRLAFLYMTGRFPEFEVDHIDLDKTNNSFSNLRIVTHAENLQNQVRAKNKSKVGLLGVYTDGKGRFFSSITTNGIPKNIGRFSSAEEAHQAYLEEKRKLHSTCTI